MSISPPTTTGFFERFQDVSKLIGKVASPETTTAPAVAADSILTITNFIEKIIKFSIIPIAVIMIIIGAYIWMFSFGDADKAKNGRNLIFTSIFGIIFISFIRPLLNLINYSDSNQAIVNLDAFTGFAYHIFTLIEMTVAIAVVATIVYSGFMYLTSGTEDAKADTAVKSVIAAAAGMFFIGISRLVVNKIFNPTNFQAATFIASFTDFINTLIDYALQMAALIAVTMIIYAGFKVIISGGEEGKKTVTNVIIGLFILLLSYGFVQFVFSMLT